MSTHPPTRAAATLAGVGLTVLGLAGCGSPLAEAPPAPSSSSTPALAATSATLSPLTSSTPAPVAVPAAAIDAAALAGVRAIEASDTRRDADPNATVRRASAWLTPGFARQVRAYPPIAAPGAMWDLWAAHRAYLRVSTSLGHDDHPADSPSVAYRQVLAVLHPIGRDGWTGPLQNRVVFVTLAPVSARWLLASAQSSS